MTDKTPPFPTSKLADAFKAFPEPQRSTLLWVRALILLTAAEDGEIGRVEETLKWGQPSYVPSKSNTGTPIRLGVTKSGEAAAFAHCQTTVVGDFQSLFPVAFAYEGNRAVIFPNGTEHDEGAVRLLIRSALRYKL